MTNESKPQARLLMVALLTLVWALALGGMWFGLQSLNEEWGLGIFLGRFHVLIVHVPIGLLCLVAIFEVLGFSKRFAALRESAVPVLWFGVLGAIAATLMGFLYMRAGQYDGEFMEWHLWSGLAVVLAASGALALKILRIPVLYEMTLMATVALVSISSHYGGALVHGGDYLSEYAPEEIKPFLGGHSKGLEAKASPANVDDMVIYTSFIQPIFDAKCTECHSAEKTKGKLRMDSFEELAKGGDIGPEFVPGKAEESELYVRVVLPPDDDEVMPPSEKEPMTKEEIDLLAWWINKGASPTLTVKEAQPEEAMLNVLKSRVAQNPAAEEEPIELWSELKPGERQARLAALEKAAADLGFTVMPVSAEDERLRINVVNCADRFGDAELKLLEPVAGHIAWLDLARSKVTDAGTKTIARMTELERLHLENTAITDAGVARLAGLTNLTYLNLYGTKITDTALPHLSGLRDLRKLFVWQTEVSLKAAREFQRQMSLEVNAGWDLADASDTEAAGGGQNPAPPVAATPAAKPAPNPAPVQN